MKMNEQQVLIRGPQSHPLAVQGAIVVDATRYASFCEAVVSCVGVGVMVVSPEGRHQLINATMTQMMALGYPEGHSGRAGQPGHVYAPDGVRALGESELPSTRAMSGEEFTDLELVVGPPGSTRLRLSVAARRLRGTDESDLGVVVVATDVTARAEAVAAQDRFVSLVSHELRTPLTSIKGYLEMVLEEEGGLPERVRSQLGVAHRNSDRLLALVDRLLHPATQGGLALTRHEVDVRGVLDAALATVRLQAARGGVELVVDAAEVSPMPADPARLADVLGNLLSNAVKFTPPGGQVRVRLSEDDDNIVLVVSDDGPGIDEEDRSSVFSPFSRGTFAVEHAVPGVGLGLHIARTAVLAHGGTIEVRDSPTGGAELVVTLPRAAGTPPSGPEPS